MPRRVLLIDDNLAVQKLVELTLRKEGYDVTSIDNGLSALDLAFKNQPDLILADYNLEGMNIFNFVQKIRQRGSLVETPIILLINSTESYDPAQLQSAGIQAFLKKPIDSRELIQEAKRQTGTAEAVMVDLNASGKKEGSTLSEHFSNPGGDAVKIEELLGWSSPGSLPEEPEGIVPAGQTFIESAPPASDEPKASSEEMGEETQFFTDPVVPQPAAAPTESAKAFDEPSLEETRYFQEPPPPASTEEPSLEEPSILESSLPQIDVPSLEESLQTNNEEVEMHVPLVPPMADPSSSSEEISRTAAASSAAPIDPAEVNELIRKNVLEIVEKVVWEVLPGMLQAALPKAELKEIIEKVAWEVLPSLAEVEIKKEIKRLQEEEK
ncbi:response regulator [Candidatus Manganitrophus noduliformans]|uniref:Response regulator n=1 Tax=Candidatus Manganitrophus noduliformans TaxID=2606439 RepID=A0A7X6ICN3_9BACT|nr:response regulator [Candidatus Manganitrophus noduliformans]NKE72700.1 response regulator [Candidatus Manganitrophus noduliformans]